MINNSCIYNGQVIHKRFKPKEHYFKYNVFSFLIDLDELSIIEKEIKFFSYNKFNLISFYDRDHGNRDGSSLILKFGFKVKNIFLLKSKFCKRFNQ